MKKIQILLSCCALLFSISCNSYKYGANAEPTQKSNLTFGVVKSKIIKGSTTQAEILEIFGSPNLVSKNKSNNEVWRLFKVYLFKRYRQTPTIQINNSPTPILIYNYIKGVSVLLYYSVWF